MFIIQEKKNKMIKMCSIRTWFLCKYWLYFYLGNLSSVWIFPYLIHTTSSPKFIDFLLQPKYGLNSKFSIQVYLKFHCNNRLCFAKERRKFYNWWHKSQNHDFFLKYSVDVTSGLIRKLIQGIGSTDKIDQINYLLRMNYL